jgi:hypothetical protein
VSAPAKCGTPSGYTKHRRKGEEACAECRAAIAAYKREYLARRPDINRKQNDYTKAHGRAAMRLIESHRDVFEVLLAEELRRERGAS